MNSRFILITTVAILLAACDRHAPVAETQRTAELERQRQAEQAASDKIRELEQRLNDADQQKAADREAELARVKAELEQVKREKDEAAERARELASRPAPVAESPDGGAIRADLQRIVDEDETDAGDPVYAGRVVPEAQRVNDVESFYEPLDSHGDWIETDDYGYVFRPAVAVRTSTWRPYTDGRWVYTDYGWTWESNEDFGWATYHYGRWARIAGAGWVWVPGREWGPGWVSWRRGDDYCGWAPLPPETRTRVAFTATVDRDYDLGPAAYIFVSLGNFGARSYVPVVERPERNVTIINKTVNITNITYNTTNNRTVVYNGGPRYDVVKARSKQPVQRVNVNFAPQTTVVNNTKIVNKVEGNNLQVAAPPRAGNRQGAPKKVKEKLGKAKFDKGWDGVDPTQAQAVKKEMAASSAPRKRKPARQVEPVAAKPADPETPKAEVPPKVEATPKGPTEIKADLPSKGPVAVPPVAPPELPKPPKTKPVPPPDAPLPVESPKPKPAIREAVAPEPVNPNPAPVTRPEKRQRPVEATPSAPADLPEKKKDRLDDAPKRNQPQIPGENRGKDAPAAQQNPGRRLQNEGAPKPARLPESVPNQAEVTPPVERPAAERLPKELRENVPPQRRQQLPEAGAPNARPTGSPEGSNVQKAPRTQGQKNGTAPVQNNKDGKGKTKKEREEEEAARQ